MRLLTKTADLCEITPADGETDVCNRIVDVTTLESDVLYSIVINVGFTGGSEIKKITKYNASYIINKKKIKKIRSKFLLTVFINKKYCN